MTQHYIIVEKIEEDTLQSILMNFANLYSDFDFVDGIQLYRKKGNLNSFLILFSNQPDFDRFNFAVNYIYYPEGYKNLPTYIRGYFNISDEEKKYEFSIGEWLMVYISKDDKQFDNINLINTDNTSYLYDFGGKLKKLSTIEEPYKLIDVEKEDYHHIIDIIPDKSLEIKTKPWWKFW